MNLIFNLNIAYQKTLGAMGADVVLMLLRPEDIYEATNWLKTCIFKQKMLQESL